MRRATKAIVGALSLAVAGVAAGALVWPDRFAVNAPLRQLLLGRGIAAPPEATVESRLRPPAGARLTRYAERLPNARFLRFTPAGDLLVTSPREGKVVRLAPDRDGDGRSDGRQDVLSGLDRPHGLDLHEGWLYVAETGAVGRVRFDPRTGASSGPFERLVKDIPAGGGHWTRTLRFGADGWMYVSIGSSCNVCAEKDPRRAAMVRYHPDGTGEEIYATGLRNAVGFDWRPADGELYATDNGRDLLGDDFPPCELDRIVAGGFYGWPIANGDRVPDPDFGKGQLARIAGSIPPVHGFRAHNAPLGITFLRSPATPEAYRGAALVALHGSWNRTRKDGYKVVSLHWQPDGRIVERDFLTGFLGATDDDVIGRPVDVAEGPDGAVYVSDDYAGSIYRIAWSSPAAGAKQGRARDAAEAAPRGGPTATTPAVATREAIVRGEALYAAHPCAACHEPGKTGPGVVARQLKGLARRYTAVSLSAYLRAPNPPMPAFPLSEGERADLAAFLLSRFP
ncbi:MAG: PQQ-dependent sugar dehydrogenase [Betaproteobacteria bacterium]